jgi:hypothetical protein
VIGIGIALVVLAAAAIFWIGRLLKWGRPEEFPDLDEDGRAVYRPPAGVSEEDERWHTPSEGGLA